MALHVARNFEHKHMLAICKRYTGLAVDMTGQPVPTESSALQIPSCNYRTRAIMRITTSRIR